MAVNPPPIQEKLDHQTWKSWFNSIYRNLNDVLAASPVWGGITGTLSNQTDLQTVLDTKLETGANVSVLTNDAGYITGYTVTESDVTAHEAALTITESQISDLGNYADLSGATFTGDISVPDEVYGVGWNGSLEVPTKNALYDKIETLGGGTPAGSDTEVQYNDSGSFGSDSDFTYDDTQGRLDVPHIRTFGPNVSTANYGNFTQVSSGVTIFNTNYVLDAVQYFYVKLNYYVYGQHNNGGNRPGEIHVGGLAYPTPQVFNPNARISGKFPGTPTVRIARDGSNNLVIIVGETTDTSLNLKVWATEIVIASQVEEVDVSSATLTSSTSLSGYTVLRTVNYADSLVSPSVATNGAANSAIYPLKIGNNGGGTTDIVGMNFTAGTAPSTDDTQATQGYIRFHRNFSGNSYFGICSVNNFTTPSGDDFKFYSDGLFETNGDSIIIGTSKTPSSASDTGTTGQIAWDSNYVYVCTATNTWKRTAIATW